MEQLNEIYRYCAKHIRLFEEKERIALDIMNEMRCPLQMASHLYEEMYDCILDWAEENDYSVDFVDDIDVEEVFWAGPGEEEKEGE